MTQPGTLRHSKAHRETVKRQWAKQMVRFEVYYPGRDLHRIRSIDVKLLVGLPAGAIVRAQELVEYGRAYRLVVDMPRSERMTVAGGCIVTPKGAAPKVRSGEVIEYGQISERQRDEWAELAGRPSKFDRFAHGAGY
jgi:hypothetical protein